jgi:hypothetical protein
MKLHLILTAAALLAAPLAANAQQAAPAQPADQPVTQAAPAAPTDQPYPATSATQAGTPAAASTAPASADQASGLTAGQPTVISNGPVPDTPENRAKYGKPMSHAGRATKPIGN